MKNEFVPYELALKLKQLGFDEHCITFYPVNLTEPLIGKYATLGLNGKYSSIKDGFRNSICLNELWKKRYKQDYANVTAPLFQQAFRWFRDEHGMSGSIQIEHDAYQWSIFEEGETSGLASDNWNGTYEEAELACLEKLIEIVELTKQ
jgi:hypothetical protein